MTWFFSCSVLCRAVAERNHADLLPCESSGNHGGIHSLSGLLSPNAASHQVCVALQQKNERIKGACSVVVCLSRLLFLRIEHNCALPPGLVANHPFSLHL